ncbi:MAG TPA: hypothetical protein VJ302_24615 [Blastocatellia bacterium]|nr:hypothetical protein [Blastocatellia bacterium]
MLTPHQEMAVQQCRACEAGMQALDRFCRRCGVRRIDGEATSSAYHQQSAEATAPLSGTEVIEPPISGRLIKIVSQKLSARPLTREYRQVPPRLVCVLIAIPIWMLIVMMSPFDALAAARAAAHSLNRR